jgi:hypothetical protein
MATKKRDATEAFGVLNRQTLEATDLQNVWKYGGIGADVTAEKVTNYVALQMDAFWEYKIADTLKYRMDEFDMDAVKKDIAGTKNVAFRELPLMKDIRKSLQKLKEWAPDSEAASFLYIVFETPVRQFNALQLFTAGLWELPIVQTLCNVAIKRAPPTTKDMTVYRIVQNAVSGFARDGFLVTSTSISKDVVYNLSSGGVGFVFEIQIPKGSRVLDINRFSFYPQQEEVLINIADKFKYTRLTAKQFGEKYNLRYFYERRHEILTNRMGYSTIAEEQGGDKDEYEHVYEADGDTEYESSDSEDERVADTPAPRLQLVAKMTGEERAVADSNLKVVESLVLAEMGDEPDVYIRLTADSGVAALAVLDEKDVMSIYCKDEEIYGHLAPFWRLLSERFNEAGKTVRLILDFCAFLAIQKRKGKEEWPMNWRGRKNAILLTNEAPPADVDVPARYMTGSINPDRVSAKTFGDYMIVSQTPMTFDNRSLAPYTLSAQLTSDKNINNVVENMPFDLIDECIKAQKRLVDRKRKEGLVHLNLHIGPLKIIACDLYSL